jgi:hypothetical protein
LTDTHGDGICYEYGAGEFKITVNGEPGANSSSSGEFRDFIRESFDVIGCSTGPTPADPFRGTQSLRPKGGVKALVAVVQ